MAGAEALNIEDIELEGTAGTEAAPGGLRLLLVLLLVVVGPATATAACCWCPNKDEEEAKDAKCEKEEVVPLLVRLLTVASPVVWLS